jgi:phosphatidylinositol phospholipase C, delta
VAIAHKRIVPIPENRKDLKVYVKAELFHSSSDKDYSTPKVDCVISDDHVADATFADGTDSNKFDFTFETEELVFVRLLVGRPVDILKDEKFAVFCARVDRLNTGWRLVRLMDMKGKDSGATLLVRFQTGVQSAPNASSFLGRITSMFRS